MDLKLGKSINEMKIGDNIVMDFLVEDKHIKQFAEATGDFNPVHVNDDYASSTIFKKRIVHGVLLSGIVSGMLGMNLPGLGTIAREMYSKFLKPVYIGDKLTVTSTVTELKEKLNLCKIEFVVKNQDSLVVGKGYAVVIPPIKN
ncbi:MAG TPA: MaoC family dehydratase [bacterium]|nr:MaoC family dehydratase [bacterium]HPN29751.1 MaoC family dehydratase [bacterium]